MASHRNQGCNVLDHRMSRRNFVMGASAAAGFGPLLTPAMAKQAKGQKKQILQVYLQGGVSQFESWDCKPGTKYGGPFREIGRYGGPERTGRHPPYDRGPFWRCSCC